MRRSALALIALSSLSVVACAALPGDEGDSQAANATGGDAEDLSSFVHLFAPGDARPVCTGAIIADKAIVVARSCVREGLQVALASRGDSPIGFNKAKVTKVNVPPTGPADIAVLEIDKRLASSSVLLTRAPLESGYTIFARQSVDEPGLFGDSAGETTMMPGTLVWMTDTQATMVPKSGTKLCARDLGAAVCSSSQDTGLFGVGPHDRCGLAGLVVAPPASGVMDGNECSGEGWKVAPLGLYADFLKQFAPKIASPIPGLFGSQYVPDGLWGFESAGNVKSCELSTTSLDPAQKNQKQLVRGKASFEGMAKRAEAVGQFGLAKKTSPNVITWVPSTRGSLVKTAAFDDTFTTDIGAAFDGEYIVSLRISANGGETWKRCDDPNRPLGLNVGDDAVPAPVADAGAPPPLERDAGSPAPPPPVKDAGSNPPPVKDAGAPPPATADGGTEGGAGPQGAGDDDDDQATPAPAGDDDDDTAKGDDDDDTSSAPPKTKKPKDDGKNNGATPGGGDTVVPATTTTESSGCSTSPGTSHGNLPVIGLLFGLAALIRRRRA